MKKTLLNGFLFSFSFGIGLIFVGFISYKVFATLSTTINGSPLTATNWNDVITEINSLRTNLTNLQTTISTLNSIPSGSIVAFNSSSCPTGWSKANGSNGTPDLRGEFIRGRDDSKGIDSGRTLGSWQTPSLTIGDFGSHNNIVGFLGKGTTSNRNEYGWEDPYINGYTETFSNGGYGRTGGTIANYGIIDTRVLGTTRPRNIALLYCIKN